MHQALSVNIALVLIFTIIIGLLYKYFTRNLDYWKKLHVSGPKPLPLVGNIWDILCFKTSIGVFLKQIYDSSDQPYEGIYIFDEPCIVLRSPEIIKQVLCTDFKHFLDRTVVASKNDIFYKTLFAEKNHTWKNTRSKLSPEFSPGRVRNMFPVIRDTGQHLVTFLRSNPGNYDTKRICRSYSIQVIARCFLGVNAHSFEFENSQFGQVGYAMFATTIRNHFSQTICFFKTRLVNLLNLQFFDDGVQTFFMNIWKDIASGRKEMKNDTNDFVTTLEKLNGEVEYFGKCNICFSTNI